MTPKQLSIILGVSSADIRKVARKQFEQAEGGWAYTEEQIQTLTVHFGNQTQSVETVAAPAKQDWETAEGLTIIAKDWLKKTYGMDLKVPVEINTRLSRSLGRFKYRKNMRQPVAVEISGDLIKYYGEEAVIDVLKHELIHYACYMLGKPHSDGQSYFENELVKHGVSRTHHYGAKGLYHVYYCPSCGETTSSRIRQLRNHKNYYSSCCAVPIEYKGRIELT